ncbi:MAG: cupin domain-containing protein [Pseudomonadota bacterium]
MTAQQIIDHLALQRHPEGGWFRETWRAENAGRATGTCIYFLLQAGERSHWHRVDATEIWLFHAGAPLVLTLSPTDQGPATDHLLCPDLERGAPQIIVPENHWQAARSTGEFTLVSCTVSPGFQFQGFELAAADFDIPRAERQARESDI